MSSASPSATHAAGQITLPSSLKVVGVLLAVASGFFIGSSFVFKKKGLLRSQAGHVAGEGVAYLKSPLWWTGMIMMIVGELCNFAAYAFVEALVVTPLGALSVVISAILSSIFLKETLTFFGWLGCSLAIIGSVVIALNTPPEATVGHIVDFQHLFLAPGFLAWGAFLIAASLTIIIYFGPRYGKNSMFWYIGVCSMIGALSVSVTTGLGAAIVTTAMGDNQFKHWFIYFLIVFVVVTLVTEVLYLNKALALFNTAMVTPTYYVTFTFATLVTTIILFQGLKASPAQIITLVMGFLTICVGITILQMSKIDPVHLSKLDRRSTILMGAARANTELAEKNPLVGIEEPGVDALRGGFGAVGSIIRARSAHRMSMRRSAASASARSSRASANPFSGPGGTTGVQLYDPPMRRPDEISLKSAEGSTVPAAATSPGSRTIRFDDEEHRRHYPGPHAAARGGRHGHGPPLTVDGLPTGTPFVPRLSPVRDSPTDGDAYGPRTAPPRLDSPEDDQPTPSRRTASVSRPYIAKRSGTGTGTGSGSDGEEQVALVSAAAVQPSSSDVELAETRVHERNADGEYEFSMVRLVQHAPRPGAI